MISVKDLSFAYDKPNTVLNNLNFDVNAGEIFGFLGPNGSGKSTTQKILMGILNNYQGSVEIDKQNLSKISKDFYKSIGVLFEMPYLYSTLSAVDNLKYFASFYEKSDIRNIEELLNLVDLKVDYRKKQVKHYSKGMKQRTSMARCLLNNPKILFLDEPVSGLDPAGAVLIKQIIKEEKAKGTTIFLTTHNMFVADELCDRVAFIVNGQIMKVDSPKNLKQAYAESIVEIDYLLNGEKLHKVVDAKELKIGLTFKFDKILGMNTKGNTLEDIFIKLTGVGLSNG